MNSRQPHPSKRMREPLSDSPSNRTEQFEELLLPHLDSAYSVARWLTRNEHDADDVVQESCLRALRFFNDYQHGDPKAWLLAIVRNTYRSWTRRQAVCSAVVFDETTHSGGVDAPDVEQRVVEAAQAQTMRDCVEALAPEYRDVLVMREFKEMSYRQIASAAGLRKGTVMSRLYRARKQLAQSILCAS